MGTVDSYKLMVKIIDLQGDEIRYEANENVKSLATIQKDLSEAYIDKAKMFEGSSSKIPLSMNVIFNSDATLLRDQAGTLSNNANITSPQSFAKAMEQFYRDR